MKYVILLGFGALGACMVVPGAAVVGGGTTTVVVGAGAGAGAEVFVGTAAAGALLAMGARVVEGPADAVDATTRTRSMAKGRRYETGVVRRALERRYRHSSARTIRALGCGEFTHQVRLRTGWYEGLAKIYPPGQSPRVRRIRSSKTGVRIVDFVVVTCGGGQRRVWLVEAKCFREYKGRANPAAAASAAQAFGFGRAARDIVTETGDEVTMLVGTCGLSPDLGRSLGAAFWKGAGGVGGPVSYQHRARYKMDKRVRLDPYDESELASAVKAVVAMAERSGAPAAAELFDALPDL